MRRDSLALDIDDQLLREPLSEEIVEHPKGIFLDHPQNRSGFAAGRRVADFGVFLHPRWAAEMFATMREPCVTE